MNLSGSTAFITGAGRGIGRAIAEAFARAGCAVALAARSTHELSRAVDTIRAAGGRAKALSCDVTDPAQVQTAVARTEAQLGPLNILVNNAGCARFMPFMDLTLDHWRQTLDVNLMGTVHCTRAVLPAMMTRRHGRIINIASVAGLKGIEEQTAYCASKHALIGLTKALALELRPHGIAVHAICPGGVQTQLAAEAMPHRDQAGWMTPEDIAHAALYLATQSPRAITDVLIVRRFESAPL
jgi:3-oxoacyl-[acyl-carrier protein] reductase